MDGFASVQHIKISVARILCQVFLVAGLGWPVEYIESKTSTNSNAQKLIHGIVFAAFICAIAYRYCYRINETLYTSSSIVDAFRWIMVFATCGTLFAQFTSIKSTAEFQFCFWVILVIIPLMVNYLQADIRYKNTARQTPNVNDDQHDDTTKPSSTNKAVMYKRTNFGHLWIVVLMVVTSFMYMLLFSADVVDIEDSKQIVFILFLGVVLILHALLVFYETFWMFSSTKHSDYGKLVTMITTKELIFMGFVLQLVAAFFFLYTRGGDDPNHRRYGSFRNPVRAWILLWVVPMLTCRNQSSYDDKQKIIPVSCSLNDLFAVDKPVFVAQEPL